MEVYPVAAAEGINPSPAAAADLEGGYPWRRPASHSVPLGSALVLLGNPALGVGHLSPSVRTRLLFKVTERQNAEVGPKPI